jgi:uncharacterized membrane protein
MRLFPFCCLFFSVTTLLQACAAVPDAGRRLQSKALEPAQTFVFACSDGYEFVARIEADSAWLFLPSETVETKQTSPATYRASGISFTLDGQNALLDGPGNRRLDCRNNRRRAIWEHAKLNGADFRAVGNEPGWHLEIRNQTQLILVTGYGSNRHEFNLPEPEVDTIARTTRYEVVQGGEKTRLVISGDSCRDSMSDEMFESKVEVVLNGLTLRGCGRALH